MRIYEGRLAIYSDVRVMTVMLTGGLFGASNVKGVFPKPGIGRKQRISPWDNGGSRLFLGLRPGALEAGSMPAAGRKRRLRNRQA